MREAAYHQGRERPAQPNQGKRPSGPVVRSTMAVNLGRLAAELDVDVLAAALGLGEPVLRTLIDGREPAKNTQYGTHLSHRLRDAGLSAAWFDTQNGIMSPNLLGTLRTMAASSNRKSPTRRSNFKKLVKAFDGRLQVLADALEVVEDSIGNIIGGRVELDDQRFGHLNPRLMAAGFPNGWLELPDAELTDALVAGLESLATDDYERRFEEDAAQPQHELFVNKAPQRATTPVTAKPSTPNSNTELKAQQETLTMTTPNPTSQPAGSSEQPVMSRGAFSAGRKIGGGVAKPVKKEAAITPAAPGTPTPVPRAMPVMPTLSGAAAKPAAKAPTVPAEPVVTPSAPIAAAHAGRGELSKKQSLVRAEALDMLLTDARRGAKVTLWREMLGSSLAYWGNIRRGAILFRDELAEKAVKALGLPTGWLDDPHFPPDTLAPWVMNADIPLPEGMPADQAPAKKPVSAAPAAAVKAASPAPAPKAVEPRKPAPVAPKTVKPFARKPVAAADEVRIVVTPPASAPTPAPAPVAAPTPIPTTSVEVAVATPQVPTAGSHATGAVGFQWQPAVSPVPVAAPGPLTQALNSVVNQLALDGKFTDEDAMRLIYFLLAR